MGSSAAAKKAWASRKRHSGTVKSLPKGRTPKPKSGKKKKGKGMPENVKQYFRLITSGMSKDKARKEAGLGPKKKKKAWGPGHPLYDWQHKR